MPPRPWPVTAIAYLLLLQTAGLLALSAFALGTLTLSDRWPVILQQIANFHLAPLSGLLFASIALLALSAAFGFFRLAPAAWVSAVLVQGLTLFTALLLYFRSRPAYCYVLMLYGIFMVLYLHQADVQAAFRPETDTTQPANPPPTT